MSVFSILVGAVALLHGVDVATAQCNGVYFGALPAFPVDACINRENRTAEMSMYYTCDNGEGAVVFFDAAGCEDGDGTGETEPASDFLGDGMSFVCDAMDCDYAVVTMYEGDDANEGECLQSGEQVAVFTDRCIFDFITGQGTFELSCDGTITNYTSPDCTGEGDTSSADDDPCTDVECDSDGGDDGENGGDTEPDTTSSADENGGDTEPDTTSSADENGGNDGENGGDESDDDEDPDGNGSSASLPAAVLALAVAAIALIA